ncbi:MAG: phosphonoacetaldehyde hydrolase [Anaerolineales bacterium]
MEFLYQRSYRGSIKAVILDWAGTTVDYGSFAPTAVFLRLFENQGVHITADDARSGMGLMKKDHLRMILSRPAVAEAWKSTHGASYSEADINTLFENFVPMQSAVLTEFAQPIPGLLSVIKDLHARGIKIGSTTGYIRSMMDILAPKAKENGYQPDCIICPDEVPNGRPSPWMCYQNAMKLDVYPLQSMVKVGDTFVDIEEGLNAGMWTVGLSQTGNLMGLNEAEVNALLEEERESSNQRIATQFYQAGAHYVIKGIWDLPNVLDDIQSRLMHGEHP